LSFSAYPGEVAAGSPTRICANQSASAGSRRWLAHREKVRVEPLTHLNAVGRDIVLMGAWSRSCVDASGRSAPALRSTNLEVQVAA
jgi:hypothetical protein